PVSLRAWHRYRLFGGDTEFQRMLAWIRRGLRGPDALGESLKPTSEPPPGKGRVIPSNLHYLCDRSDQEGALGTFFAKVTKQDLRRPFVIIVHGHSQEAHGAFVD